MVVQHQLRVVLQTDIVSSTETRIAHGDYRTDLLEERLKRLIVRTADALGGSAVDDIGDGGTCLFASVSAALEAAAVLHREGRDLAAREGTETSFRVGITVGELYPIVDDEEADDGSTASATPDRSGGEPGPSSASGRLHGYPLLEVTRICADAEPGTTLVAHKALVLVRDRNRWDVGPEVTVHGKGIIEELPAHQVMPHIVAPRLPPELRDGAKIPLLGRSDALDTLLGLVSGARAVPGPRLISVVGEAGMGKTRLLTELIARTTSTGAPIGYGAFEPNGPPFNAVLAAAQDLTTERRSFPPAPRRSSGEADTKAFDQLGYFQTVGEAIAQTDESAVLIVDDLHWADPSTIDLLAFLLGQFKLGRTIVVGCRRGYEDRIERLAKLVGFVGRVELDPLPATTCSALVRSVLPPISAGPDIVGRLAAQCGGSPLVAMVLAHGEASAIAPATPVPVIPVGDDPMGAVVGVRLADATAETKRVLTCAAVTGELDGAAIAEALTLSPTAVEAAFDEAARRLGLVRYLGPSRWAFIHDTIADAVAATTSDDSRAELHLRMARAIGSGPKRTPARVARHLVAAADLVPPAEVVAACVEAADAAVDDVAYAVAADHYALAAAHAAGPEARLGHQIDEARCSVIAGSVGARAKAFDYAQEALDEGLARLAADALLVTDRGMFGMIGSTDERFVELAEAVLQAVPAPSPQSAHLRALLAAELVFSADVDAPGRREGLSDAAVAEARSLHDDVLLCQVLALRGMALRGVDGIGERRAMCEELQTVASGQDDPWLHLQAAVELGAAALEDCDPTLADACVDAAVAAAERLEQPRAAWLAMQMETARLIQLGRLDEAEVARQAAHAEGELADFAIEAWVTSVEQRLEILRWQDRLGPQIERLIDWAGNPGRDLALSGLKYLALAGERETVAERVAQVDLERLVADGPAILHGAIAVNLAEAALVVGDKYQLGAVGEFLGPHPRTWFQTLVSLGCTAHHSARVALALDRPEEAADLFAVALEVHDPVQAPLWWTETVRQVDRSGLDVDGVDADVVDDARRLRDRLLNAWDRPE